MRSGVYMFKHTGHSMHDKITTFTTKTLGLKSKQLNDQINITFFDDLNTGKCVMCNSLHLHGHTPLNSMQGDNRLQ